MILGVFPSKRSKPGNLPSSSLGTMLGTYIDMTNVRRKFWKHPPPPLLRKPLNRSRTRYFWRHGTTSLSFLRDTNVDYLLSYGQLIDKNNFLIYLQLHRRKAKISLSHRQDFNLRRWLIRAVVTENTTAASTMMTSSCLRNKREIHVKWKHGSTWQSTSQLQQKPK